MSTELSHSTNEPKPAEDSAETWKVVKTEPENHDTTSLYLAGEDETFAKRRAGQWLSLRIPRDASWSEPHPFTISCAPEDKILRLTIKRAGLFTSSIPELKPGTLVRCEGPFGVFCKNIDQKENIVMIAGGVGITPFLSVVRHFRNAKARNKVTLFWSNKTMDDAFASDELREMTTELNLITVHTLSRQKEVAIYFRADAPEVRYVSGYIAREALRKYVDFSGASFYLCGPPKMQEFVLGQLEACGADPQSVEKEKFTF